MHATESSKGEDKMAHYKNGIPSKRLILLTETAKEKLMTVIHDCKLYDDDYDEKTLHT